MSGALAHPVVAPNRVPAVTSNIGSHLPAMAATVPFQRAVVVPAGRDAAGRPTWSHLTFAQLDRASDVYAAGLLEAGIGRGSRTVLMVKPSLEFFALTFALFKVGAVLVLIDPGIGRRALLQCLQEVAPEAFVGVPAAHVARLLFPKPFRHVRTLVTVGRKLGWGGHTLESLAALGAKSVASFRMADSRPDEKAAILFTSGSTGIPKGAIYTHGIFDAQVRQIRELYSIEPGEIDLSTFPAFALFDPALGMTSIIPEMDARFPAKADPRKLVEAIEAHGATNMFGSPALVDNLSRYTAEEGLRLPSLKRILSSGAPMRRDILERMQRALVGDAQIFTPFGATESLPVASIGSAEVLAEGADAAGRGICVGRPAPGALVRIIRISDEPIETWSPDLELPQGEIGEITVRGDVVSAGYYARPEQTRLAKIREGDAIVHRMGDVGFIDPQGRIWMCGRKGHRVELQDRTLFSEPVEQTFNQHPAVRRSALVQVTPGRPALVVEREPGSPLSDDGLVTELLALARERELTKPIQDVLIHPDTLPVDRRHNAKIERERLAIWAAEKLR